MISVGVTATNPAGAAEIQNYLEGQVIVQFKSGATLETARLTATNHTAEFRKPFVTLSQSQGRVLGLIRSRSKTTAELIASLRADPAIAFVEPDFVRHLTDLRPPDDAKFSQLWALRNSGQTVNGSAGTAAADIGFLKAWGLARPTTSPVIVAVIDTGVDVTHPDLTANVWTNASEIPKNGLDDDANGYVDDAVGYDFASGNGNPSDSGQHGTHVAGTVAASGQNGVGVIGVAFRSQIMALKASANGTTLLDSAIIAAIDYCVLMKQRGTNIVAINASFGGPGFGVAMRNAIESAGNAGIIFCAAAGNDSANNDFTPNYPASYRLPNMIVVAASDQNDALAGFSNYGATTVDLAAPGANILSALPVNQAANASTVQWSNVTYPAEEFVYSGITTGITATIYHCGLGYPADFSQAVSNNIALIQRGQLFFSEKVANATAAGARAVIIYNNVSGSIGGTLQTPNNWIPAIGISQANGLALAAAAPTVGTVINAPDPGLIYQFLSGTSMATPQVAGAVAFAAMNFPTETVPQRIARILQNVTPLPGLAGKVITGGRLNLARTVDTDQNGLPDWWEQQHFNQATGVNPATDADGDGASNLAEWLAGTNPTNALSALRLTTLQTTNGLAVTWPSAAGRYYRVLGMTNAAAGLTQPLRSNIAATPPMNTETNLSPIGTGSRFYRLELEP